MLERIKLLLGIKDNVQDDLLNLIITMTEQQFILFFKLDEVPVEYDFIILEVAIKRFNRIGNEGMETVSVEGHSIKFSTYDFNEYAHYFENEEEMHTRKPGKVRFI